MERRPRKLEERDEMENPAGIKGEKKNLQEHNLSSSMRLIDLRTSEENNQRAWFMKRFQG